MKFKKKMKVFPNKPEGFAEMEKWQKNKNVDILHMEIGKNEEYIYLIYGDLNSKFEDNVIETPRSMMPSGR